MTQQGWQSLHLAIAVASGLSGALLFLGVAAFARLAAGGLTASAPGAGARPVTGPPAQDGMVAPGAVVGTRPVLGLLYGTDGRLSTSKCQWFAWTLVIVGGYCAIVAARGLRGDLTADIGFPAWLLAAMGFSSVTVTAAKGITSVQTTSFGAVKRRTTDVGGTDPQPPTKGLLTDDAGDLDLAKTQLITWTIVAIGIWVSLVAATLGYICFTGAGYDAGRAVLPDIGATLLVLTGLSHGAYLGKKLVTLDSPSVRIDSLLPSTVAAHDPVPQRVTVLGSGFGENGDGRAAVKLNGVLVPVPRWSESRVDFEVPANQPAGVLDATLVVAGVEQEPRPLSVV